MSLTHTHNNNYKLAATTAASTSAPLEMRSITKDGEENNRIKNNIECNNR